MIKQYKKELIVSTLLALLPIAAGLLLWNRLPGQLATHWGMHGADRWSGKVGIALRHPPRLFSPAAVAAGRPLSGTLSCFPGR